MRTVWCNYPGAILPPRDRRRVRSRDASPDYVSAALGRRVAPGLAVVVLAAAAAGSQRARQRFEPPECGGEVGRPGPARLQAQLRLATVEGEPRGDVQQAVAQPLGLAGRKLAAQRQRLGPGE